MKALQRLAVALILAGGTSFCSAAGRPNILWLSCEDMGSHLGCYGDPVARTPHIDRLAGRSIRYTQACSVAGVCAPSRSAIITGLYPTTLGTHLMRCRAKLPPNVQPFPVLMRKAGYYCTNNSKTDYQFEPPRDCWDDSSSRGHWRNRPRPEQPFFAVFNFTGTHESAVVQRGKRATAAQDAPAVSPDAAAPTLPPYYPDTPAVRQEWARYYECIAALDAWVGKLLAQLEADGLTDETIVFFWSDHGAGLPRAKRWLYDSGVRVPLMVRVPTAVGGEPGGRVDERLVSLVDLGPTVLRLAGIEPPEVMQGQAFLGAATPPPREHQYLVRDRMDERYDIVRGVRTARWKYLRNFQPWKPYYQHVEYGEQSTIMQEIRRAAAAGTLPPGAQPFAGSKPSEELYDLSTDPHETHNLAGDTAHRETLLRFRAEQLRWSDATGDLGLVPEWEIARREAELGDRRAISQQSSSGDLLRRLQDVAGACSSPADRMNELLAASADPEPAVRCWALTGIGLAPVAAGNDALRRGLHDESTGVRVSAARALAARGDAEAALAVLETALLGPDVWLALEAALALDEMGPAARPLLAQLERLADQQEDVAFGTRYAPRVARHIVHALAAP